MLRIFSVGLYGTLHSVTVLWRLRNCRDIIIGPIIIIISNVIWTYELIIIIIIIMAKLSSWLGR